MKARERSHTRTPQMRMKRDNGVNGRMRMEEEGTNGRKLYA